MRKEVFQMKKLITACMALVALAAFALPATASATNDPDITHPTGTLMATNTKILATNTSVAKFSGFGGLLNVECQTASMTGTLVKNNGTEAEGTIETAKFSGTGTNGDCTSNVGPVNATPNTGTNGTPWCLRSTPTMATDEFQVRGNSCSSLSRPIRFALDVTNAAETCVYERSTAIPGTYTTHPSDAVLSISSVPFTRISGSAFVCPSEGSLTMSFTLETDTTASADPLYIS
jgi:hypothetical protein